jgi:hypothetical protein
MSWVEIAQTVEGWATLGIFITAFAAALFAFVQVRQNRATARESSAYKIFEDHMMLAFKYPEYSQPDWETIQKDSRIKEQYSWYVGSLLWACDELLSSTPQTESWRNTIRSFIRTQRFFDVPRLPKG